MSNNPQVLVCGEALIDMVPRTVNNTIYHQAVPGGSPFNVAIGLGRLALPVAYLGRLSQDANGAEQLRHLQASHVATEFVQIGPEPSAMAYVFPPTADQQDVSYSFYFQGTTEMALQAELIPTRLLEPIQHLHCGSISMLLEPHASIFRNLLRQQKDRCCISFDPNARPSITPDRQKVAKQIGAIIADVDLVKASDADIDWLYPGQDADAIAEQWLNQGPKLVVVTHGGDGASAYSQQERTRISGRAVDVADTVGAGDSFLAALLFSLWRDGNLNKTSIASLGEQPLRQALELASAAAALTCTRVGANPPTQQELEDFL